MWDPEQESLSTEFSNFFESYKLENPQPLEDLQLILLPLHWNVWKLDAIVKAGLIYEKERKIQHLKRAFNSVKSDGEKDFFQELMEELSITNQSFTHLEHEQLLKIWGFPLTVRIHFNLVAYPSHLSLIGESPRHIKIFTETVGFTADYKHAKTGIVKQLKIHGKILQTSHLVITLKHVGQDVGQRLTIKGRDYHDEKHQWKVDALIRTKLLSNQDNEHKLPSLLRWLKSAKIPEAKMFFENLLAEYTGKQPLQAEAAGGPL